MLRVGLTGGLGSGKSTVAAMLAAHGAEVLSSDAIGRELMRPGQTVYAEIVKQFGAGVVREDGELDRAALATLAFEGGRVEELNAVVHPAVITREQEMMATMTGAVVVVESALIFETKYGGRERFDCVVLVTAKEATKVARFVARAGGGEVEELEAEARRRLARQIPDERKAAWCDYVLNNDGGLGELQWQVDGLWPLLMART